jgi:hypothetical protein
VTGATARWAGQGDVSAVAALLAEFQDVFNEGRPDDETLRAGVRRLMDGETPSSFSPVTRRWGSR